MEKVIIDFCMRLLGYMALFIDIALPDDVIIVLDELFATLVDYVDPEEPEFM